MVKKPMKAAGPLIFAAAIAAAVLISVSGIRCYAVLTGSMEPVLPVGSLLVVVPMSFDELKVGQDITYKTAGGTVTHRIVAIDQAARTVTTQGLTNNVQIHLSRRRTSLGGCSCACPGWDIRSKF